MNRMYYLIENVIDSSAKEWLISQMKLLRSGQLPGETAQSLHQKFGELQTGAAHLEGGKFVKGPAKEFFRNTARNASGGFRSSYADDLNRAYQKAREDTQRAWQEYQKREQQKRAAKEKSDKIWGRVGGSIMALNAAIAGRVAVYLKIMSKKIQSATTKQEIIEICDYYQKKIVLLGKKIDIGSNVDQGKVIRSGFNSIFQSLNNILVKYDDITIIKRRMISTINRYKKTYIGNTIVSTAMSGVWLRRDISNLARKAFKK